MYLGSFYLYSIITLFIKIVFLCFSYTYSSSTKLVSIGILDIGAYWKLNNIKMNDEYHINIDIFYYQSTYQKPWLKVIFQYLTMAEY